MIGLTQRQGDLLTYLRECSVSGWCPSYEQMMVTMNLSSKSGISRLIIALEDRGHIRRLPGLTRAIHVIPDSEHIIKLINLMPENADEMAKIVRFATGRLSALNTRRNLNEMRVRKTA